MTETVVPTAPPRGWYSDPAVPGGERWWSGDEWTGHRWRPSWLERHLPVIPASPAYSRSIRIGANVVLRPVIVLEWIVILLLLTAPFVWLLAGAGDAGRQAYIVAVGIQVGLLAAALTLGIVGVALSRRLGGFGAALWGIAMTLFLGLLTGVAATIMLSAIGAVD